MRTRAKRLIHYGITEERGRELLKLAALEKKQDIVRRAAMESNSYLAPYLVRSLRQVISLLQNQCEISIYDRGYYILCPG